MKKIISAFILLLSLLGCSNNVISNSTCPCENLTKENDTKYTIESLDYVKKDEINEIYIWSNRGGIKKILKIEYLDTFYNFIDREYLKTNMKYIEDNYDYDDSRDNIWAMSICEERLILIKIYQLFLENGDSYLFLFDSNPYISTLITKEENENFLNSIKLS